nr:hypothetical protein [Tanacetum cinerariifolium]
MTGKIKLLVTVFRDGQLNRCSLKVKKTDTIKDVRHMIENEEGIDTGTLYLIAVNPKVELEDTQTLEELQIYDGFNLFLAEVKTPSSLVEYGLIKIFYKMVYTGDTQSLLIERSDSIETLKLMIQEKSHIPEEMQRLSTSYRRQLIEQRMTLDDYGISYGDTLLLDIGGPIRVNVFLIHSQRTVPVDVEILDTPCVSFKIPFFSILSAGLVQISVTMLTGESIILEVNRSNTISYVRSLVESRKEVKTPSSRDEYGLIKIFYKMVYTGDTQTLLIERSDSIETLKLMIQEKSHIPKEMQLLSTSYRRRLIKQCMTLDDYGISYGDTLLLDLGGPIRVDVFLIHSQRTVPVDVEILDTVDAVKSKIQNMEGIPASKQWLKGSATDADLEGYRTLADCEVGDGGTLYLQIAPMRININFYPTKEIICLKVDKTETIDNVKAKIH